MTRRALKIKKINYTFLHIISLLNTWLATSLFKISVSKQIELSRMFLQIMNKDLRQKLQQDGISG